MIDLVPVLPTKRRAAWLLALAAFLLASPTPASADDASAERTFKRAQAQLEKKAKAGETGVTRCFRTDFRRCRGFFRFVKRFRSDIRAARRRVSRESASTPTGARARRLAIRGLTRIDRALRYFRKGVHEVRRGRTRASRQPLRRAVKLVTLSDRDLRRATKLFRQARAEG
jgi:hypothetical protein